jgi:four helix bundle protein
MCICYTRLAVTERVKITSYRDLKVWQQSKLFVLMIYKITAEPPSSEQYGLISQMRRASVSIPSNIAEGFRRGFTKEQIQFLRIAYGSGAELETQLEIGKDLGYISQKIYDEVVIDLDGIMRMLNWNIHHLSRSVI